MIGKFTTKRRENSSPSFFLVVVNSGRQMDDIPSCLTLRNIADTKGDEKQRKSEKTSGECRLTKKAPRAEGTSSPVIPRKLVGKKKDVRPEIHIEGTSLNHQNVIQGASDKRFRQPCVQSGHDEQATSSSKDENQTDGNGINTKQRSLMSTPEIINTTSDCASQDIDESELGLARAQRSLNPSPWKEIWAVLQDKNLVNCPLSTKSVEFVRDISESAFSTRTNPPFTKPRRGKPQRIPPLYNTRKTIPTTHGKANIPSFETAVTFNTFFKEDADTGVADEIGKCKECGKLAELKDHSSQRDNSFVHTCGKQGIEGKTESAIGLPKVRCPQTDRYKSKFRVKLLPLVTKSDSLPNLTSETSSAPSELIVSAHVNAVARSTGNICLSCSKTEYSRSDIVKETELINKRRISRSMSLESVFSIQSFASYQERESVNRKINVQGLKVLPEIKPTHLRKRQKHLREQSDKEVTGIPRQTTITTLPWKCN